MAASEIRALRGDRTFEVGGASLGDGAPRRA
jgi:hypothetical protein